MLIKKFILLIILLILVFILSLKIGAASELDWQWIIQLRLPRGIMALAVGAGLAVAGCVLQVLFSNPLCEPYTLGISSGATLGAVVGISIGIPLQWLGLSFPAFLGAILFTVILYSLQRGRTTTLLMGVMMGFVGSSLVALWMALSDPSGVYSAVSWLLGDLTRSETGGAVFTLISIVFLVSWFWIHWKELDAFLLGEEEAKSLGVDTRKFLKKSLLAVSFLVGICVSSAGMIGFVGLIVPHIARRMTSSFHYQLIPFSALLGGVILLLGDVLARVVAAPSEIPVGVITALAGAPFFMWVLKNESK